MLTWNQYSISARRSLCLVLSRPIQTGSSGGEKEKLLAHENGAVASRLGVGFKSRAEAKWNWIVVTVVSQIPR